MAEPHTTASEPNGDPDVPPDGWKVPFGRWDASGAGSDPPPGGPAGIDVEALIALVDTLRRAAPAELQDRLNALMRETLLTLRSLIDWYLERLDEPPAAESRVESIPID